MELRKTLRANHVKVCVMLNPIATEKDLLQTDGENMLNLQIEVSR